MDPGIFRIQRLRIFGLWLTLSLWFFSGPHVTAISTPPSSGGRPCSFNILCSCDAWYASKHASVTCDKVPFGRLPLDFNKTSSHTLILRGNGISTLEGNRLMGSNVRRLEISGNGLEVIEEEAFNGVSDKIEELFLQNNALTNIPSVVRKLSQLKVLNLKGNSITSLDINNLPESLTFFSIADNLIGQIPWGGFQRLSKLVHLYLSGNSLRNIQPQVFPSSLQSLNLARNLFSEIPSMALTNLLFLSDLDLSHNLITAPRGSLLEPGLLRTSTLDLSYNMIETLPPNAFASIRASDRLSLAGNPLANIAEYAFWGMSVQDLDLSSCLIQEVYPGSFAGLENSLQTLALDGNKISHVPPGLISRLERLTTLSIDDNDGEFHQEELKLRFLQTLSAVNVPVSVEELRGLTGLKNLSISSVGTMNLDSSTFDGLEGTLMALKISNSTVKTINNETFNQMLFLQVLDFSNNKIWGIEPGTFARVPSVLILHNAVTMKVLDEGLLSQATGLKVVDLSSNKLTQINEPAFQNLRSLTHVDLRFNKISYIPPLLFHPTRTPRVEVISLSFNRIKELKSRTFSGLRNLERLELNENEIQAIQPNAFDDLPVLRELYLGGNNFVSLRGAMNRLPSLSVLDISYCRLREWVSLHNVKSKISGPLEVDLSHNNLQILEPLNPEEMESSLAITTLSLSFNNISLISPFFFRPHNGSLTELDLSNNIINSIDAANMAGTDDLRILKLNNNQIMQIDPDAFKRNKPIQVISLDNNQLTSIHPQWFSETKELRILTMSGNVLEEVGNSTFKSSAVVEVLDLSDNQLQKFPNELCQLPNLVQLDLSNNKINFNVRTEGDSHCVFSPIRHLLLARNEITKLSNDLFCPFKGLQTLDLSSNPLKEFPSSHLQYLNETLRHLNVANTSLVSFPQEFPHLRNLVSLNASSNSLTTVTIQKEQVARVVTLDLSDNELNEPPDIGNVLEHLKRLYLAGNPIKPSGHQKILYGAIGLHYLDVSHWPMSTLEFHQSIWGQFSTLKKLKIGPASPVVVGTAMVGTPSLQEVHLEVVGPLTSDYFGGFKELPPKLSKITLSSLTSIDPRAFMGLQSRAFTLALDQTPLLGDLSTTSVQSLGNAVDFTLEIHGETGLRKIGNPNPKFSRNGGVPKLEDLVLTSPSELALHCNCANGWIEFWAWEWLHKTCPVESQSGTNCKGMMEKLRSIHCYKGDQSLAQAFKTDLECGWEGSSAPEVSAGIGTLLVFFTIIWSPLVV